MKRITVLLLMVTCLSPMLAFSQGCASPGSDEGVKVWGYLQPEFNTYFYDENEASFQFRRMRIGVMGNVPYDFSYYVLVEASNFLNPDGTGNYLLDAFITYNRFRDFKVSVGSFKYAFGRELSMGCHKLYTINRSRFVDELSSSLSGGNRDLGIMFLGGNDTTLFNYQLAVTNGTGVLQTENNILKTYMFTGRVTVQPVKGFYIGLSGRYSENPPESEGVENNDTKMRWGVDGEYRFKNLRLIGEYIHGEDEGSYTEGGGCGGDVVTKIGTNNADGWMIMGVYRTSANVEPVYKVESYKTIKSDNSDTPASIEDSSVCQTFGVNYYPNDWTRLQVNYIYRAEQPKEINNDMLLVQLQIQF